MIQELYETHLQVTDMDRAIDFYQNKLGFELGENFGTVAFFWLEKGKKLMLGLWLVQDKPIDKRHIAFGKDLDFVRNAREWLLDQGIEPIPDMGKAPIEPIIHTWVPAASIYFYDPDGNKLEYISVLDEELIEFDTVPYLSEWEAKLGRLAKSFPVRPLYETHLYVRDLERSIAFYRDQLGLELAHLSHRGIAFFWNEGKKSMLGLWKTDGEIPIRHFAWGVHMELMRGSRNWLIDQGIEPWAVFGRAGEEPIVHAWMPAASMYFKDPDGHELEFLTLMDGEPRQYDKTPYLSEWEKGTP